MRTRFARWLSVAVVACLSRSAVAGSGSSSFVVVFASTSGPRVAAALRQRADFVAAPVTVKVDLSDPARRFTTLRASKAKLAEAIAKHEGWILHDGRAFLSVGESGKLSSYGTSASDELTVLAPLAADGDPYEQAALLVGALTQFEKETGIDLGFGRIELAVRDPQQYRAQLLKLVADEAARARESLAPGGEARIAGLEGPVLARQVDDRDVELYLEYRLSVRSSGKR
jgi:hypothetical protein